MKRPEETNYPTSQSKLQNSKDVIEQGIDLGTYTFTNTEITDSPELRKWLKNYGWQLLEQKGDFRDNEPNYYSIKPL